jgi:two-component system NarL family response regulator
MTTYEGEQDIRRALRAGAKGYLVKGTAPEQIREAVRRVAEGESWLPAAITSKLVESMAHPELSERERQILQSIAEGRSNKEIGQVLYISEDTVKSHVKSIFKSYVRWVVRRQLPSRLNAGSCDLRFN